MTGQRKIISKILLALLFSAGLLFCNAKEARALDYNFCSSPDESPACAIALAKLKTIINPITGKAYFDDGIHYVKGKLFDYPDYQIATPDLDDDGYNEIIVTVPEWSDGTQGLFCKAENLCPFFIIQDRNLKSKKPILKNFKAIGPIFAVGIGLSTDEKFSRYKSLRVYKDPNWENFDVYQYDSKNDEYFNINTSNE